MSKQLKLRFQKLLKKADFVQADLEYHEELIGEAKTLFSQEVAAAIKNLSPELQQKIRDHDKKLQLEQEEKIRAAAAADTEEDEEAPDDESSDTSLAESEHTAQEEPDPAPGAEKMGQVKKLYRQIAALTHPDKAQARGLSLRETAHFEKIFIQAKTAYEKSNWYVLYSLALLLDLDVAPPSAEQLNWLEEDIRTTMASISIFGNMLAWMWYNGDGQLKHTALNNFFEQAYGISIGPVALSNTGFTDLS